MFYRNFCVMALAVAVLVGSIGAGEARKWKPKPYELAQDYAIIEHQRTAGRDVTVLMWLAPEMVADGAPNGEVARELLRKYLIIGAVRMKMSSELVPSFPNIQAPIITAKNGIAVARIHDEDQVPTVRASIAAVAQIFSQALGPMGKSSKWFVFRGTDVDSCANGGFDVLFEGVSYRYDTPIPGCGGSG